MIGNMKKRIWTTIAALAMVFTLPGCVAVVAAGAAGGTVAYMRGELQLNIDSNIERVHRASLAAVREMGFVIVADEGDKIGTRIRARTAQDKRVLVHVDRLTDQSSRIRIRVGHFGDEAASRAILERVLQKL